MRQQVDNGKISVHAIAGSHVVLLGFDAKKAACKGLLGFAIHRTDHAENEAYWLKGFKTFEETQGDAYPGQLVSTQKHPVQGFLWGDYSVKPGREYTYRVVPMYGSPKKLEAREEVVVTIASEPVDNGIHGIFFNRGAACSQAYARKFGNRKPNEVPDGAAHKWLSRGLEEAILSFVGQAQGLRYALRAAVYEFSHRPVLEAFKRAAAGGADVKIVYDARPGKSKPVHESDEAIQEVGIRKLMIGRTKNPSYIAHNKFIILLKDGVPEEVWTGSTNLTESGIFGHSNVGHLIRDPEVAQKYYEYWGELAQDSEAKELRPWNDKHTPVPDGAPPKGLTPIFSPRGSLTALDWYAKRMREARNGVCFTAAFGVSPPLSDVLQEDKAYLRYVLLERPDEDVTLAQDDRDIRVAVGAKLEEGSVDRALAEWLTGLTKHVHYIHTKYMLLDPLSDYPITISGSANFSEPSTKNNDENMLVDSGDTRLADCYLGEFMRLFNHFYFRDIARRMAAEAGSKERSSAHLASDDSWAAPYFREGTLRWKERLLFRGRTTKGYGITFFDIDETLFHTFAKIWVIKDGRVVRKLSNTEYNTYQLQPGESFDYREFRDGELFARSSKVIRPILAKFKAIMNNALRTGSRVALLTARTSFDDAKPFRQKLAAHGIDVEHLDINFAGDIKARSVALAKKKIVLKYLASGEYHRVRLVDDNKENLAEFLAIAKDKPDIHFTGLSVDKFGGARTVHTEEEARSLAEGLEALPRSRSSRTGKRWRGKRMA